MEVAPRPLIRMETSSPSVTGISVRRVFSDSSAISREVFNGPFHTPGSPWIPIPIAISFSFNSKLACPTSGMIQGVNAKPTVRVLSFASCAAARTSSREPPSSALAPAALNIK